jgi:hypothetical protein
MKTAIRLYMSSPEDERVYSLTRVCMKTAIRLYMSSPEGERLNSINHTFNTAVNNIGNNHS